MSTLDSPSQAGISAEVEPTFKALRAILRPLDYQQYGTGGVTRVLGHYRLFSTTAAAAFAGAANLAAFRHTDPSSLSVILRVYCLPTVVTAVTAQRVDPIAIQRATGYTVAETTNNTNLAPVAGGKMRTSMGNTLSGGNIQVASAAAGLTGGTRTLDPNFFGAVSCAGLVGLSTGSAQPQDLYNLSNLIAHPLVLAQNEGFLIQWGTTTLASGTVEVGIGIDWAEVATF